MRGNVCYEREIKEIAGPPAFYSLDGDSDEEKMVRSFIVSGRATSISPSWMQPT